MASTLCLRCFARLSIADTRTSIRAIPSLVNDGKRAFSVSSPSLAKGGKGPVTQTNAQRKLPPSKAKGQKSLRLSKGKRRERSFKIPGPGERKALRKRIVLSNVNALEVQGISSLSVEAIEASRNAQKSKTESDATEYALAAAAGLLGHMASLPGETIDFLRAIDSFKPGQAWSSFRRPCVLVRQELLELSERMQDVEAKGQTVRRIITGEKGTGKSVLLLQAHAMAHLKRWVVIHFPEGMCIL